jgi:phenylacetate-CoA ligase
MIGGRRVLSISSNNPPYYRYNFFEKQVYISAYHISAENAENYLKGMQRYKVQYMTGYAMSNFFLARFFKEQKLNAPQLKAVLTSSEKLTNEMREVFKEVYGCKTFDSWSGVEACALITECEHGSLHISPDAGLIEVLDENMQPVNYGEAGEIYCTGFINYDQPLIRYAIGDSIILSDETCACGRAMPVVQEILGRNEDVIIGKDGREMVRFHSMFNGLHSVKQAQVIQESIDDLVIKIVADEKLDKKEEQLMRERIISQLGDINIYFDCVDAIPLNKNGKFQAVISKVKRTKALEKK